MKTYSAYLNVQNTNVVFNGDPNQILNVFVTVITNALAGNNITLDAQDAIDGAQVVIELIRVDEGNQMMRWIAFSGAAVFAGRVSVYTDGNWQSYDFAEKKSWGIMGGDSFALLSKAAKTAGINVARFISSQLLKG